MVGTDASPKASACAYLKCAGDEILRVRRAKVDASLKTMMPREDYEYMPEVLQEAQPGRQRLVAWEDCRAKLLAKIASELDMRLSQDQTRLLEEIRNALLIKMYGNVQNVMGDLAWLRANYGVQSAYDAVAIIFPRRSGKTLTQTIASATTAVSQPRGNVLDFNPNWEQAKTWLAQTVRFMYMMKDDLRYGWTQVSDRASRDIVIYSLFYKCESSVHVYGNATNSRNAQNLRGTGNNAMLVNFDEGFFFSDEAYQVILPVVANGAAFVITSSMPVSDTSSFNLTKALNESGRPVMHVHNWSNACGDCLEKERRLKREITCRHGTRQPSNFRSKVDEKRLQALMKPFGAAAYNREILNTSAAATAFPVFDASLIDRRLGREAPVVADTGELTHFFVGVDPGSASRRSDTGLVAFSLRDSLVGYPLMEHIATPLSGYCTVRHAAGGRGRTVSESDTHTHTQRGRKAASRTP